MKKISVSKTLSLPSYLAVALCVLLGAAFAFTSSLLRMESGYAVLVYLAAGLIYLPFLLALVERGLAVEGPASTYHLARSRGSINQTFFTAWLALGGYICTAAILGKAVVSRLEIILEGFFPQDFPPVWLVTGLFLAVALMLSAAHRDKWRARSVAVGASLVIVVFSLGKSLLQVQNYHIQWPSISFDFGPFLPVALVGAGLWFMDPVLSRKSQVRQPKRNLPLTVFLAWGLMAVLGIMGELVLLYRPDLMLEILAPSMRGNAMGNVLVLQCALFLIAGAGMITILNQALQLLRSMMEDGFLRRYWLLGKENQVNRAPAIMGLVVFSGALCLLMDLGALCLLSALLFFLACLIILAPTLKSGRGQARSRDAITLPLHPLFPALACIVGFFFCFLCIRHVPIPALIWAALGLGQLFLFARHGDMQAWTRQLVMDQDGMPAGDDGAYRVLVWHEHRVYLRLLLAWAEVLAAQRGGEVVVQEVVPLDAQVPLSVQRANAQRRLDSLTQSVSQWCSGKVTVTPLIRLADNQENAVLDIAREFSADLILTSAPSSGEAAAQSGPSVVDRLFIKTASPIMLVRGRLPSGAANILALLCNSRHDSIVLSAAHALAGSGGGSVTVGLLSDAPATDQDLEQFRAKVMAREDWSVPVEVTALVRGDLAGGMPADMAGYDMMLLSAGKDSLLQQTTATGFSFFLAERSATPSMVAKGAEPKARFWLRRLWGLAFNLLPTLHLDERYECTAQMGQMSQASKDFYTLILISSAIALFGLLLDSTAVIIGAMLVAPLMSPILSMGHAIVVGDPAMFSRAAGSTLKGMTVAIGFSALIVSLFGHMPPTSEIMGRIQPNFLDLLVAVAAGAAGAYSLSRRSVAAAMPGVAIAVALVPPLCVVGYGLGSGQLYIAGGAMTLFLCNLLGIIATGALIFLLLGFRPEVHASQHGNIRKGLLVLFCFGLLVTLPVWAETVSWFHQGMLVNWLESSSRKSARQDAGFRLLDYSVRQEDSFLVVDATVLIDDTRQLPDMDSISREMSDYVGVPVKLRAVTVPARFITGQASPGQAKPKRGGDDRPAAAEESPGAEADRQPASQDGTKPVTGAAE